MSTSNSLEQFLVQKNLERAAKEIKFPLRSLLLLLHKSPAESLYRYDDFDAVENLVKWLSPISYIPVALGRVAPRFNWNYIINKVSVETNIPAEEVYFTYQEVYNEYINSRHTEY